MRTKLQSLYKEIKISDPKKAEKIAFNYGVYEASQKLNLFEYTNEECLEKSKAYRQHTGKSWRCIKGGCSKRFGYTDNCSCKGECGCHY